MLSKKKSKSSTKDTPLYRSIIRRPYKKQLQWSEQVMVDAMKAVQEEGSPIASTARMHGVPKTSLHDRMMGRVVHRV